MRLPTLPDVPTFAEAGFADAQVLSWYVIAVRAGTPLWGVCLGASAVKKVYPTAASPRSTLPRYSRARRARASTRSPSSR